MATHALSVVGTGGTTAGLISQIGSDITLPAGGPWIIFGLWGMVVKNTTVPNEGSGGALIINSLSGDLTPDPAPGVYPMVGTPATISANDGMTSIPLNMLDVRWNAAGKSVVQLSYLQQLAITTASVVSAGILFGDTVPVKKPLVFCDSVRASFASAAEQSIGTITLAEKATRIVGIMADLNKGDIISGGEPIMATIRLASDDVRMPPMTLPCNRAFNAADGTPVGGAGVAQSQFIPVDIPVTGGARIDVFATTTASVTANADILVYIAYE